MKQSCYFGTCCEVCWQDDFRSSPPLWVCAGRRPGPPTHWSGLLNAAEVAEKSPDWHMDAALTARLQIALIASLAFHRLKSYGKLAEGAINAASSSPSAVLCPPAFHQHVLRYTSDIQEAGVTSATHWFFYTSKTNYRLDVFSIMSLCKDLAWRTSFSFQGPCLDKHPEMMRFHISSLKNGCWALKAAQARCGTRRANVVR